MSRFQLKTPGRGILKERLPWFVLVSLLAHHALITLFVTPPAAPPEERTPRYEIIPITDVAPDEIVAVEQEMSDEAAVREKSPPEETKEEEKTLAKEEERAKKEEEKEEKKEEPQKEEKAIEFQGLHYVDIRSNESKEPPKEAKYFAPINSVVDEETRADNTNLDHDDGASSPAQSDLLDEETPGDAAKHAAAHVIEEDSKAEQEKGNENKKLEEEVVPQTPLPAGAEKQEEEKKKKAQESGAGGTPFVLFEPPVKKLTPDNAPEIKLEKTPDGQLVDPETGEPAVSASQFFAAAKLDKKKKKGAPPADAAPGGGEDVEAKKGKGGEMDIAWKDFEGIFGKKMEEEKAAYEEAKKNRQKGGFTKNIDKVMSQLENFNPDVKPGNQTALDAAFHPFAEYLTAFHRKLHPQWGDGYLASLMTKSPSHPHNDMTLWCKLEFVVKQDGMIGKVTVVHGSGDLAYDVAAIDAVYGGEPYPPPPDIIKSHNGKVYMRWGFYRNESQCGVWNAEPYIIPAPSSPIKKIKLPKEIQPKKGKE